MKDRIVALIPAFNEEMRINSTVTSLSRIGSISRIIVVDDGSTDSTETEAVRAGAEVIRLSRNMGKGKAINMALPYLNDYEVLLLLDADLTDSASEVTKLLEPVVNGSADMAIADFPKPNLKGGFGLVKGLAAWGIKKHSGLSVKEPLSGQRAISHSVIDAIKKFDSGFSVEVGLTIDAARNGFTIIEVPTKMSHAATGRNLSGFVHRGRQFYYVLRAIIQRVR